MKRERNSFSWLLRTVAFFIAMQLWTPARSGYSGLATAVSSHKSPGEMDPEISILIGSNATITCRLYEPKSSQIWFEEENSKTQTRQPSDQIKIIDSYTAVLIIPYAVEQKSRYQCKIGDYGVDVTKLFVGTAPQNVTDFSCIVYEYDYMLCSFTRPTNMVFVDFQLRCAIHGELKDEICILNDTNHKLQCRVPNYLPVREKYIFTLTGVNAVGQNVQKFTINNHKIVKPSPISINKQNVTSESITLTWQNMMYKFYPDGLYYEIQISEDNRTSWQTIQTEDLEFHNLNFRKVIKNLYAFWYYWIKVRVKSNSVDKDSDEFWSNASMIGFKTFGKRPQRAPETPLGSFYIDSSETQVRLYWEQLPEREHNGPDFHYVVNEINRHNVVILTTKTNETSTTFAWKNESMQIFTVNSANSFGENNDGNTIRVFRSSNPHNELNENMISKVYHNKSYTLSWTRPINWAELMNYTVFWCLPKIELQNQCKGPISYKYLDKSSTNFTTEPKDRSLNLALSANYQNNNKGMQWARCSGEISSELMNMDVEVTALNKSSILVKWSSGIVCTSTLKGYNLTYCQVSNGLCTPQHTVQLLRSEKNYRNYTISDFPPFTNVCVRMLMFSSKTKHGHYSDDKCVRTKASAPSPPKNITYLEKTVTSKSAVIEWMPPDLLNGILSQYTIHWRKSPNDRFENKTTSIETTNYTLTGLSSYSSYEVFVTAHTVEESVHSEHINFTTLIGNPSRPGHVNISENDSVVYWDQPYLPSERHSFYVVALFYRNNQNESVYERASVVKGRSCRFQWPDCVNEKKTYYVHVRAVNVGDQNEIDTQIKPMNEVSILEGIPIDNHFCESDEFFTHVQYSKKYYFASPWTASLRSNSCPSSSNAMIYAVALIIAITFGGYLCYWVRNKCYKMNNIKVILPEGLVDQVSNYKLAGNGLNNGSDLGSSSKKEFHSDISRSNDCLVAFGQRENQFNVNLMSNFHNGSSNALSSLSSSSISKGQLNEDQTGEHPSLETTNEELSSNSSSISNSNLTYHDHRRIERLSSIDSNNTVDVSACEQEDDNYEEDELSEQHVNLPNSNATQNAGYVTHNSQLLASILNGTDRIATSSTPFTTTFPAMTNDGYIQPSAAKQLFQPSHHPPPSTNALNGYTSLDDVGKMSVLLNEIPQHNNVATSEVNFSESNSTPNAHPSIGINMASRNLPLVTVPSNHHQQTSPVITDLHESIPDLDINKDAIPLPHPATLTSQQSTNNNNNNNTIYGYVTQQQLANFGTNVALGKELNT